MTREELNEETANKVVTELKDLGVPTRRLCSVTWCYALAKYGGAEEVVTTGFTCLIDIYFCEKHYKDAKTAKFDIRHLHNMKGIECQK